MMHLRRWLLTTRFEANFTKAVAAKLICPCLFPSFRGVESPALLRLFVLLGRAERRDALGRPITTNGEPIHDLAPLVRVSGDEHADVTRQIESEGRHAADNLGGLGCHGRFRGVNSGIKKCKPSGSVR